MTEVDVQAVSGGDERVDDAARARAAHDLAAAAGAGLLRLDETDQRLTQVWAATTAADLARVHAGIPQAWLEARRRHEAAEQAREEARRALPGEVLRWLALVALLVGIWALTTPSGYFWPVWPALGTGIGLAGRAAAARRPAGG